MQKDFQINNIEEIAQNIYEHISGIENESATILAFSGDLGAGKTTLTQQIAKIFGVKQNLVSPTFTIMKNYEIENSNYKNLIHIDAYRLENDNELVNLGWDNLINNKQNLIIIEWPERVISLIPKDSINVKLDHVDENTRRISF